MKFTCKTEKECWKGNINTVKENNNYYEIEIISRSSIYVILGKCMRGGFACIPDFEAGCYLVDLRDIFWNREKLISVLGEIDGITVAKALYVLGENKLINI